MRSALFVSLLSIALVSCADQTGILVQIASNDIAVPADVDGLTIRAFTPDGLMLNQSFAIRSSWPQSLLIRPAAGEALGEVRIEVTATAGGSFAARRVVMTAFMPGIVRHVDVQLSRSCLGVMCADQVDCVAGACLGAGVDSGTSPDASTHDGGVDAADDVGTDAGSDAGSDGGNDAATPCAGASCLQHVVISELSTYMSNEFVELYNRGGTSADLSGCVIEYFQSGTWMPRGTLAAGTTLPSHGYYLLTNVGYTGTPAPDVALWNTGFVDTNATVRLMCSTTVLDEIGYGAGATQREGTPTPAIDASMLATASYERRALADSTPTTMAAGGRDATAGNGFDSNDNSADFVIRLMRDPQSSISAHEP